VTLGAALILVLIILSGKIITTDKAVPTASFLEMRPFLCGVTQNSVWVLMGSATTTPVTVEYGTTKQYGSTAATTNIQTSPDASPSAYVHNIKLPNLKPETRYYYRVQQGTDISAEHSFKTAANPGTAFRFSFMSDSRSAPSKFAEIASGIKAYNPDFILFGGDLCTNPDYSCFKNEWLIDENLKLIAEAPVYLAPGNREGWGGNTKVFFQGPANYDLNDPDFYSFDYGDLHVAMVNTELPVNKGSAQYNWLKKDLSASTKTWKIVFQHKPVYSAGGYETDTNLVSVSKDIFEPYGVKMVLAGHAHFYQHNLVNGIHHMILGSAGVETTTPGNAPYTIMSRQDNCYAIIDVSSTVFNYTAYDDVGAVIESFKLKK